MRTTLLAPMLPDSYKALLATLHTVTDLRHARAVLEWDQETYMPDGAAEARALQIATLEKLAHERFISDKMGRWLEDLTHATADLDPDSDEAALVRVTKRDYLRAVRLPVSLVEEMAQTSARALEAWKKARASNQFQTFAPSLDKLVELNLRKAAAIEPAGRPYDALLEEYEPGMKAAQIESVFDDLRKELVPMVDALAEAPTPDTTVLRGPFEADKQWKFGLEVLRDFGYDFACGRQDRSTHPFTTSFSTTDVRITTRIREDWLPSALFGSMHECGHALYEQGISPALERTPLADGTSLGIHESQSRLWENQIGRSRTFWSHYYPKLVAYFPDRLSGVDLESFYRSINTVAPSPIRVEADEVTYNLHIMLRFRLELALLEGDLTVADLPDAWNAGMQELLGITPSSDAEGCLQDIHWSMGAFGYFPTYALGNLVSAQLFDIAKNEIPNLEARIAAGSFGELLDWLRENVHRHGRKRTATRILNDVTGTDLSADNWLAYIRRKYGEVYGVDL